MHGENAVFVIEVIAFVYCRYNDTLLAFLSEKNISVPGRAYLIALSASIVQSLRTEYSSYTLLPGAGGP